MAHAKKQARFGVVEGLIVALIIAAAAFAGWYIWNDSRKTSTDKGGSINSFEACKKAGNPIQLSYPEVCATKDGKRFENPEQRKDFDRSQREDTGDKQPADQ